MDWRSEFAGDPDLRGDAHGFPPTVQRENDQFVTPPQMLAIEPLPEWPVRRQAMANERVSVNDR